MTLGRTRAVALVGLNGAVVDVEAFVTTGLPAFLIGGLPDAACRQSADRIKAVTTTMGLAVARRKVVVNLSPASLPKNGSGFDLAIAVAVLAASENLPGGAHAHVVHLGELSLDGSLRPIRGVLPSVLAAHKEGFRTVVVPAANAAEARLVPGMEVIAARSLFEVVERYRALAEGREPNDLCVPDDPPADPPVGRDLAEVAGQATARYALELAAAGGHHLYLVGPPGSGKTLLAECLPSILPDLSPSEALDVTAIHSLLGVLPSGALVSSPPYVAPHHGASMAALIGGAGGSGAGGSQGGLRPGLISQAHHGVLFLDEAPEFRNDVLQALRQPLESGWITVARARGAFTFPARFQLIMAANPCPCGLSHGKGLGCTCTPYERRRYQGRLAGPLLDRVDLQLEMLPVPRVALTGDPGESSEQVKARVERARAVAGERWRSVGCGINAHVPGSMLRTGRWRLPARVTTDADLALERGLITLRGYDRILRLAWTAADLAGGSAPGKDDVSSALTLRVNAAVAA